MKEKENEIDKEIRIRENLIELVKRQRMARAIESLGGWEGLVRICKQLRDCGLTVEKALTMTDKEFMDFLQEKGIEY